MKKNRVRFVVVIVLAIVAQLIIESWPLFGIIALESLRLPSKPEVQEAFPLQEKWSFVADSNIVATPEAQGEIVYFSSSRRVYAMAIETGSIVWVTEVDGLISYPIKVAGNLVIVGGDAIWILDLTSGKILSKVSGWSVANSAYSDSRPISLSGATLLYEDFYGELIAYDINAESTMWARSYSRENVEAYPDGESVYVVSHKKLASYNIRTGELLYEFDLTNYAGASDFHSGVLYYEGWGGQGSDLTAFDTRTQAVVWKTEIDRSRLPDVNKIVVSNGQIFVGGDSSLSILDLSGNRIWENTVSGSQEAVMVGDVVYFRGVFSEDIYALSVDDGRSLGRVTFNTLSFFGQPHYEFELGVEASEDLLFFCMKNKIFAYEPP